jgi:hypothetical protein
VANSLGYFNPVFYAQETLKLLEQNLAMARTVHRGYEGERGTFERGQYINIPKPSTFTAATAPASTVQDISTGSVQIELASWEEVTFGVTDKEKAYTGDQIIQRHLQPAAYAIAKSVNASLHALYKDIPWYHDIASTPTVDDVIQPSRILFENGVPSNPADLFFAVSPAFAASLKGLSAFSQNQGAGAAGIDTQMTGAIGQRYGMQFYEAQQIPTHTKGTSTDVLWELVGAHTRGASTIAVDGLTADSATYVAGDTIIIEGNTQRYSITALVTSSGTTATVSITPPLVQDYADNADVVPNMDTHVANLAYHRNAFALVMAPLDDDVPGGQAFTATDPNSGLSVRASIQWNISTKKTLVSLDALWGVKTLDPNMAVRARG